MAGVRDSRGRFVAGGGSSGGSPVKVSVVTSSRFAVVDKAVKEYQIESVGHAAAIVRLTASRSIRRRKGRDYAKPGKPPKTGNGLMRKAIAYHVDRKVGEAVIGPTAVVIDHIGALHELGGKTKDGRYKPRPYMGPAFDKILPRLPQSWRRTIRPGGF